MGSVEKKQYMYQRKVIGYLVLLLSPLSILFGLIGHFSGFNPDGWWWSISDTYYANSQMIMASIISIAAFFFCTYEGYDWRDRVVNLISGIGLFGLLIFPCSQKQIGLEGNLTGLFSLPGNISVYIHTAFTLLAFAGIFINEMFIFTLGNGEITAEKKKRNIIYRCCASGILVSIVVLLLGEVVPGFNEILPNYVWVAEFIALTPCGIAWLVKGEALKIFNDK